MPESTAGLHVNMRARRSPHTINYNERNGFIAGCLGTKGVTAHRERRSRDVRSMAACRIATRVRSALVSVGQGQFVVILTWHDELVNQCWIRFVRRALALALPREVYLSYEEAGGHGHTVLSMIPYARCARNDAVAGRV